MEDLTQIKGVVGCGAYAGNNLVAGTQFGRLGDRTSEIEQFWAAAASVVAANLKMGSVQEMLIRSQSRQVLIVFGSAQNIVCELAASADWRAVAAEVRRRI